MSKKPITVKTTESSSKYAHLERMSTKEITDQYKQRRQNRSIGY
jgi:hypothetical protein